MQQVFVLLFNARTENEGIHTLKIRDSNLSGGREQEVILAFEGEDDALRFALYLEAQDFPNPTVEKIERLEIEEFCHSAGYALQYVPKGELLTPPPNNETETDWQPDTPSVPARETTNLTDLDRIRQQLEGLL